MHKKFTNNSQKLLALTIDEC